MDSNPEPVIWIWFFTCKMRFLTSSIVDLHCASFRCIAKWFSYIYIHVFFLILVHYGFLQHAECRSLCYTLNPCCLSILYIMISVNLIFLVYPSPIPFPGNHTFCFLCLWVLSVLNKNSFNFFLDSTYKWYHMIFVFPCLTQYNL